MNSCQVSNPEINTVYATIPEGIFLPLHNMVEAVCNFPCISGIEAGTKVENSIEFYHQSHLAQEHLF